LSDIKDTLTAISSQMKNFMNYQTNNTAYAKSKNINGSFVEHGLPNGKRYQTNMFIKRD
jgi:hypothetical protein